MSAANYALQSLPDDVEGLRALVMTLMAERDSAISERDALADQNERIRHLLLKLKRMQFGAKSERLPEEQLQLGLESLEQAIAQSEAEVEKRDPKQRRENAAKRRASRGALPAHLPRIDLTHAPENSDCPCCRLPMTVIGEDTSERLDVIPVQFRVIVTHRPKLICRSCAGGVVQMPAPPRLIEGGIPTEAMVAHVLVARYADHQPLYRQAQIMARQGVVLDRSTLSFWMGYAAAELAPVVARLRQMMLGSVKLFADETVVPVLDPGRGRTKQSYFWAIARDDRPWGGSDPPAVVYSYAPGRGHIHAYTLLGGYRGIVQCDGYQAYKKFVTGQTRSKHDPPPVTLAFCCWCGRPSAASMCQAVVVNDVRQRRPTVEQISRIGMDTSKHVFQLHGVDDTEVPVLRKKLRRKEMVAFFERLTPTTIAIEACGASHHWARLLHSFGHTVKLIPPQLVKPYVKRGKNDAADAEALCEAMSRPTMRYVPVKTAEQQAALMLVGVRDRLIRNRTQLANAIRGYAGEFGLTSAKGKAHLVPLLDRIQADNSLPTLARELFVMQAEEYTRLQAQIEAVDAKLAAWQQTDECSRRLIKIPGIGPIGAAMLTMKTPAPKLFPTGRQFAAWIGLTPKDHSTGGKVRLGVITRAGDEGLRSVLVVGATAVIKQALRGRKVSPWLVELLKRKPVKLAAVALANKMARIAWKLMATGEVYTANAFGVSAACAA